jgi:hypothetical protein
MVVRWALGNATLPAPPDSPLASLSAQISTGARAKMRDAPGKREEISPYGHLKARHEVTDCR